LPVTPSAELEKAVDEVFGEETYYVKVDTSLPERAKTPMGTKIRQWRRR